MSSPRLATAMAALFSAFRASGALAGVTVTEAPNPSAAGDSEFIVVGHDGALEADGSLAEITESGTFAAQFVAQGSPPLVEETGFIHVVAVSQSGDSADLPGRITRAQALWAACADACTDLRSGDIVFDLAAGGRLLTRQGGPGCAAIIPFDVPYSSPW